MKNDSTQEYSIEKFKTDYFELLEQKVMPVLSQYENERISKRSLANNISVVIVILTILVLIYMFLTIKVDFSDFIGLVFIGAAGIFAVCDYIKKSFEKKVKRVIMPTLMRAIPGFYWQETPPVTRKDIKNAHIFEGADSLDYKFDDCFLGSYRGVEICMSECCYKVRRGRSTYTVFSGVIVRLKMNKKFTGITVVRPAIKSSSDLKSVKLEPVKLEDVNFNNDFQVYSDDQIESRYLLTTSFMERLQSLSVAFDATYTYCSFYEDSVYIALNSEFDLFDLCSLSKPITEKTQFGKLFEEFVSILELVDHFKLDKKLGL